MRRASRLSTALLASGAVLTVSGQIYLTLANEPGRYAPEPAIFALLAGLALFALGAFGRSANDNSPDALDSPNIPGMRAPAGKVTPASIAALSIGFIAMATLAFRLLSGSKSGWDMLPWLLAIGAFAAPFILRPNIPARFRISFPPRYYADILIVLALVGVFVGLNTHDLTDWYYSAIGDEYAHYNFARELAENGLRRPFDLDGVYGEINPVMASVYPALVMRLVGIDNFGWKFSLIIGVAATIPAVYILGNLLAGRIAAIVSATFLAFSHYIFAFTHTGYPNTDVLPIIAWSVTLFVLGWRRGNPFLIYASGLLAGFGLLFNIVARAAIAIIFLYALSQPEVRRRLAILWPWALGVALTVLPLLLVNGSELFSTILLKIVSPASQHASEYDSVRGRIIANAAQNLLAFNYNSHTSHYVSGPLMDPVSAILALLGLGYCLGTVRKASSRLLLIILAVIATGTALLSPYAYVPITRMVSMVLPLSLMAGAATAFLFRLELSPFNGETQHLRGVPAITALTVLGAAVLVLNLWQFRYATPAVFHHTQEAVAIGALRSDKCAGEPDGVVMLGRGTVSLLGPALDSYRPGTALPHLLDHSDLQSGSPLPADPLRCVILLNPKDSDIQPFKQELAARYPEGQFSAFSSPSGKASVEVFSPSAR